MSRRARRCRSIGDVADYDRGDKLAHYQRLPSLRAVIFVSRRERRVTLVEREPSCAFGVDEIYEGVTLDPS